MKPRTQLVARCCGSLYRRWRGRGVNSCAHEICCRCGSPLEYLKVNRIAKKRALGLTSWRRKVEARYAAGLTSRGTPRKYKLHNLGSARGKLREARRQQQYKAERREARQLARMTPLEQAWRAFRAGMGDTTIPELGEHGLLNGKDRK